jgi:hypothetical protein
LDDALQLGTEGYSPAVLRKAIRQAGRAPSFKEASADLRELAGLALSPAHLQRLAHRVGGEWAAPRDADVAAFRRKRPRVAYRARPQAAAVMIDGGRVQTRAAGAGPGVADPQWRESKVACLESLRSEVRTAGPQPDPPRRFLDRQQVARLAAELKAGRVAASDRKPGRPPRRRRAAAARRRPRKVVRTVLASLADSEAFGWQVAAEVHRRGLHTAARKAYVCDGQKYNWSIYRMHFVMLGFVAVLDVVRLVGYLCAAARAACGQATEAAWALYRRWLRRAWAGRVKGLLRGLRAAGERLGRPPGKAKEEDPRKAVWDAAGYVENNRDKMDYPRYRKLGLPISSAAVESTIKRVNRRLKGTEKFWLQGGGEALAQVRAAYLSEDGRAARYWAQPRPHGRAVGAGRLGRG